MSMSTKFTITFLLLFAPNELPQYRKIYQFNVVQSFGFFIGILGLAREAAWLGVAKRSRRRSPALAARSSSDPPEGRRVS